MKPNMGLADRLIRALIAVFIAALYLTNVIGGVFAAGAMVIALVFVVTALLGVCPLYKPFGISTKKRATS